MERLKRLREPAAVVAIVAMVVHLVVILLSAWVSRSDWELVAPDLAYGLVDPVLLLLVTALVLTCWTTPPTPHARGLTIAALAVTGLTLLGVAGFAVAALVLAPADVWSPFVFHGVSRLTVAVLTLGGLIALLGRPRPDPAPAPELEPAAPEPKPVDLRQQPAWTPDAAVGTVWRRAGDAGSQRPATSWDAPGDGEGGWGSDTDSGPAVQPTRRTED